jgi:ankyrin repeat protein
MDTYLKLTSVKNDKNCNCISPFYINNITGINPNTGRDYDKEDLDAMKTALYRISAAKGCSVSVCCDPNDSTATPDSAFTKQFTQKFPKIMPMYQGSQLTSIKLSTTANVTTSGWQDPTPYLICKITKATIQDTSDPTIKMAVNLVNDCYSDSCNSAETITVNTLLQNAKADMNYTTFDDARVTQSILEDNISYVKEYIRKYKGVNFALTNDDYNNRMIHLAAGSKYNDILTMLIALKADLNVQNKLRETPIHFAVRSKNLDNIGTLLGQGVDLTIPNNNGETPMFYAMATGDLRIINMLYMNNSPIQGVDKNGNNLIHYCVLNCPSYRENDDTVPNTKGEIIQFLIDHGISTEQKNNAGITPLEMVSKQINKEINKECSQNTIAQQNEINEKFFNIPSPSNLSSKPSSNISRNMNGMKQKEGFTSGASGQDISGYTTEHVSLLDIQSKLFNNILRNNPDKYGDYISVDDIPKGAPIQVLDTVCVGGTGITGNEDSDECIAKGGSLVKIKNRTTKIKLQLLPEEQSQIDLAKQSDLYYPKEQNKIPIGTVPTNISSYNASVKASGNILPNSIPQTTGITYNLGTASTNTIPSISQPTQNISTQSATQSATIMQSATQPITDTNNITTSVSIPILEEHPNIIDENNEVVHKCKKSAINNATRIATTSNSSDTIKSISAFTDYDYNSTSTEFSNKSHITFLNTYRIPIIILAIVIFLVFGVIIFNAIRK